MNTTSTDIKAPNTIGALNRSLRSIPDWKDLDIADIKEMFKTYPEIGSLIIGLWSFDFLKNPTYLDESLVGYGGRRLDKNEQLDVITGLLSIIRNCRIDSEDDEDAVDLHYSACGKLFRLTGNKAEDYLVEELKKKPEAALIEALGVLVGTEYQGRLQMSTVDLIKDLANSNSEEIRLSARSTLINDINRVNEYTNFLSLPGKSNNRDN